MHNRPSSENEDILRELLKEGLDGARFNFSYGTQLEHLARIQTLRKIEKELGLTIPCILDTKGSEIRIGKYTEPVELKEGQKFTLTINEVLGDINTATISYKDIVKGLKKESKVLINDGFIELKVDDITDTDIICTVIRGGVIDSNKNVNLPGTVISLPFLAQKDLDDIKFGVENGFDFIATSFTRTQQDCLTIKNYLKELNAEHIKIIAKIENQEGLNNFNKILPLVDGIIVARGDLGAELSLQEVPLKQKIMLKKCCKSGKIGIISNQMLISMTKNPRPTRAEVTDISNAIFDGSSAIMFSDETTIGNYLVESLRFMKNITLEAEKNMNLTELS